MYDFADALGQGLGSVAQEASASKVWNKKKEEEESSNWREFTIVVDAIEEEVEKGISRSTMKFMLTENSTAKGEILKGSSLSRGLLKWLVRIK